MKVRELAGSVGTTRAIPIFWGRNSARSSARVRLDLRESESHMLDDVIAKLRALDFRCSFHQARKIVGDTFAGDGGV
jgi:hypothetical protein